MVSGAGGTAIISIFAECGPMGERRNTVRVINILRQAGVSLAKYSAARIGFESSAAWIGKLIKEKA